MGGGVILGGGRGVGGGGPEKATYPGSVGVRDWGSEKTPPEIDGPAIEHLILRLHKKFLRRVENIFFIIYKFLFINFIFLSEKK